LGSCRDGLSGLSITLFGSLAVITAGIVLAIVLRGWQRFTGPVLAVLVPLLLWQSFNQGDQVSYHELTENRASRIEQALERYYSAHGRYPTKLSALTPYYILSIPEPVILRHVGWCYRGGEEYYQLGTYHREFFGMPTSFRVYAQAGSAPDDWACEEKLDYVEARYQPAPMFQTGESYQFSPTTPEPFS
jgi:type II secretory pathway pseudopilin PulG